MEAFTTGIPYKINIDISQYSKDLILLKKASLISLYRSQKYFELYVFGNIVATVCYLWFNNKTDLLETIDYKISKEYFNLFEMGINNELPINQKLIKDKFVDYYVLETFLKGTAISLRYLNEDFFIMRMSKHPSLPRIKSNRRI